MKELNNKDISFKSSFFYLVIAILSVSLGRFFMSNLIDSNTNINLLITFVLVAIFSYILAFKLISPNTNKVSFKKFIIQVLPLFVLIGFSIGLLLDKLLCL